MLVCVLVLMVAVVVVVVLAVVLVWMVLTVWVVVEVLGLVVATEMVQKVLVEVVTGSGSGAFLVVVVVVALDGFGLVLWSSWRMVLWCWNKRGYFLGRFSLS